jgi:hypothetical protein
MSGRGKSFKKVTLGVPFLRTQKKMFFHFFNAFNFLKDLK